MELFTLIEAFTFLLLSLMIFNLVYNHIGLLYQLRKNHMKNRIESEIQRMKLKTDGYAEAHPKHRSFLLRNLSHISKVFAFEQAIDELLQSNPNETRHYLASIEPVWIIIADDYRKRNNVDKAYYPYLLNKYYVGKETNPLIKDLLVAILYEKSLNCRYNAFKALLATKDYKIIIRALRVLNNEQRIFFGKLISDALNDFKGNKRKLANEVFQCFNEYIPKMKVILLDFIRFSFSDCGEFVYAYLNDTKQTDEVRLACIRYFGTHMNWSAYEDLLNYAREGNDTRWEYNAVASSALAKYPNGDTIEVLKDNLSSRNWYIRYNSADSLRKLGVTYHEMIDIFTGKDIYSQQIFQYHLDFRKITNREYYQEYEITDSHYGSLLSTEVVAKERTSDVTHTPLDRQSKHSVY